MKSADQLSMFEPEGEEALALLQQWLRTAENYLRAADTLRLCQMQGAAHKAELLAEQAARQAFTLAVLLDLEREASL